MDTVFTTDRLLVRRWTAEDVEEAYEIYRDPQVTAFLGDGRPMADTAAQRRMIDRILASYLDWDGMGSWAIQRREDDILLGAVLLKPLPDSTGDSALVEVGWHLASAHWGYGYATEAARGALDLGWRHYGRSEIYAVVNPANHRSQAVARRLGMSQLARTTRFYGVELDLFRLARPAAATPAAAGSVQPHP
ncbi:MAG: GNAT family N-acetyltransferase [Actinomycetota bacterium]|nr:GNAT family N-acetyltransferase [Actinomycetota bacterium]